MRIVLMIIGFLPFIIGLVLKTISIGFKAGILFAEGTAKRRGL